MLGTGEVGDREHWSGAVPDTIVPAERLAAGADLMVAVGSSLQVFPAAGLPIETIAAGGRLAIVNDEPTPLDELAAVVVSGRAADVLPTTLPADPGHARDAGSVPSGTDPGCRRPDRVGRVAEGAAGSSIDDGARWRVLAAIAVAAVVAACGLAAAPAFGSWLTMPAAVAVAGAAGVLLAGHAADRFVAMIAGASGIISLGGTAVVVLTGRAAAPDDRAVSAWALAETAGLFLLTLLTVRIVSPHSAAIAATLTGIALPVWLLRFGGGAMTPAMLGGFAAWAVVSLLAVLMGLYLRATDERRARAVAEARRAQRHQIASDLHDFVAHDISGMLAQAQAGQILAERDPAAAKAAFRRIEQSGRRALASMDQSVHVLRDHAGEDADRRMSPPTLTDVPDVISRFAATGPTATRLDVDADLDLGQLPREITTTGYRLVVEALTNVRRHAPDAERVTVTVRRTTSSSGVEIVVTDDGATRLPLASGPAPQRRGGLGLSGLAERVDALGGALTAGPADPTGWRVAAFLPLPTHGGERDG